MNAKPTNTVALKVMTGPCAGKEFLLAPGEYTLGNGSFDDVSIADPALCALHANVCVTPLGIQVEPLAQPLRIDGKIQTNGKAFMLPYQVFSAGTTQLSFSLPETSTELNRETQLETVPNKAAQDEIACEQNMLDDAQTHKPVSENNVETQPYFPAVLQHLNGLRETLDKKIHEASENKEWLSLVRRIYEKVETQICAFAKHIALTVTPVVEPFRKTLRRIFPKPVRWSRRPAFGVGVAMLAVATVIGFTQVRATGKYTHSEQGIRYVLEDLAFQDVNVGTNENDQLTLLGYLDTDADKRSLIERLEQKGLSNTNMRLQTGERLVESVDSVLRELELRNLRATYLGGGGIAVDGYVSSDYEWQETRKLLRRDFPALRDIQDDNVVTLDVRVDELQSSLQETGLAHKLEVLAAEDGIKVSGMLNAKDMLAWRREARDFKRRYKGLPKLINKVNVINPGSQPDIDITGTVVSSSNRFFLTAQGMVYREGDLLPDGSEVKSITAREVVFTRHSHDFVHPLPYSG